MTILKLSQGGVIRFKFSALAKKSKLSFSDELTRVSDFNR